MEIDVMAALQPQEAQSQAVQPIGKEQLMEFTRALREYHVGTAATRRRIVASENWWKLRNTFEEGKVSQIGQDGGFTSRSAWMHNVISSKHADFCEAFPESNIRAREQSDEGEATMLSSIIPCILEQNGFEATYSDVMWQKCKTGTGVYKVVWDGKKLNGLGDIGISRVNLLNLYWEPGVTDIQRSRYFFQTELMDKDLLMQKYPQLQGKVKSNDFVSSKFLYDDTVKTEGKATVIEVYYKKHTGDRDVLHYCKYIGDEVIFSTENDTQPVLDDMGNVVSKGMAETGLYDHGRYPYEFDSLFPIEGSPCGYGYVDVCQNPQTEIDLMKTSFVKNAMVGAIPRFFSQKDGAVNETEFLDLTKPIVHVSGNVDERSLRQINLNQMPGVYVNMLDRTIQELRETTGNTETSTGTASGVTAASAIAALQEASGKGSRDAIQNTYRTFNRVVWLCIELIRQFYDLPRTFRILGEMGAQKYVTYTNQGLKPQQQGEAFGQEMGTRKPEFDITVSAQKASVYTKVSQNELALQMYQLGFFNPNMVDQSLLCLEIMDFDGKEAILQKVSKLGGMMQMLQMYMPMALQYAMQTNPMMAQRIAMDMQRLGMATAMPQMGGGVASLPESDNIAGIKPKEHGIVTKARQRAQEASQPDAGAVVKEK